MGCAVNKPVHLVIADPHVRHDDNYERFRHLGKAIVDILPDVIILLGDWCNFDSVSSFECHGRPTLSSELAAAENAMRTMMQPLKEYNKEQARKHRPRHYPRIVECLGNHEERLKRHLAEFPESFGSVLDLKTLLGYNVPREQYPYGAYAEVDDILYTHCPWNKMGKPITGLYRGRKIAMESMKPVVYGHTHSMDYSSVARLGPNNQVNCSLNAPAFMDTGHIEPYAKNSQTGWYYGFLVIRPSLVEGQPFGFAYVTMDELKEQYG